MYGTIITQPKCRIDRTDPQPPALTAKKPLQTESTLLAAFTLHHMKCIVVEAGLCVLPANSPINLDKNHIGLLNKNRLERFLGHRCHQPDFHQCPLIWSVTSHWDDERSPPIDTHRWGHFIRYDNNTIYIYLWISSSRSAVNLKRAPGPVSVWLNLSGCVCVGLYGWGGWLLQDVK